MVLLDTNYLYYISGVIETLPENINMKNLKRHIQKGQCYISELTVIEFCVHYRNDIDKIKCIINTIKKYNIRIINYPHKLNNRIYEKLFEKSIIDIENNESELIEYINNAFELKIRIESQFILFWSINVATIYLGTNIYPGENYISESIQYMFANNLINLAILITGEEYSLSNNLKNDLRSYYKKEEKSIKNIILNYTLEICEYYIEMYYTSLENCNFFEFIENYDIFDINKKEKIVNSISSDAFFKKIEKRKNEQKKLVKPSVINTLENNMVLFEKAISKNFNQIVIKYYSKMFTSFFVDNKKIEKNAIIDSLLLNYYPSFIIITNDKYLNEFIAEYDHKYYENITKTKTKWTYGI